MAFLYRLCVSYTFKAFERVPLLWSLFNFSKLFVLPLSSQCYKVLSAGKPVNRVCVAYRLLFRLRDIFNAQLQRCANFLTNPGWSICEYYYLWHFIYIYFLNYLLVDFLQKCWNRGYEYECRYLLHMITIRLWTRSNRPAAIQVEEEYPPPPPKDLDFPPQNGKFPGGNRNFSVKFCELLLAKSRRVAVPTLFKNYSSLSFSRELFLGSPSW